MRYDEIRKLLSDYFVEAIKRKKAIFAERGRLSVGEIDLYRRGAAYGTDAYQIGLDSSPQLTSFFDWSGLKVEDGSKDHHMIATQYEGAYSSFCQQILDCDQSLSNYDFGKPLNVFKATVVDGNVKTTTLREVVKHLCDPAVKI